QEDHVVLAHDMRLIADLHQRLAFEHVIDLLLDLVGVLLHVSHRLVHRDAVIDVARLGILRPHQRLRQRAAEMIGKFLPRHFGDVADEPLSRLGHVAIPIHFTGASSLGKNRSPNTGSRYGVGGSCQAPVAGGCTLASTWTSSTNGLCAAIACSSAPSSSSDFATVTPSAPLPRAHAAKSGLYGALLLPR